jgi:hypothetical protein
MLVFRCTGSHIVNLELVVNGEMFEFRKQIYGEPSIGTTLPLIYVSSGPPLINQITVFKSISAFSQSDKECLSLQSIVQCFTGNAVSEKCTKEALVKVQRTWALQREQQIGSIVGIQTPESCIGLWLSCTLNVHQWLTSLQSPETLIDDCFWICPMGKRSAVGATWH